MFYIKKAIKLGPKKILFRVKNRLDQKAFALKWAKKAEKNCAGHTWKDFYKKLDLHPNFSASFTIIKSNKKTFFIDKILKTKILSSTKTSSSTAGSFYNFVPKKFLNARWIIKEANEICKNNFLIFGAQKVTTTPSTTNNSYKRHFPQIFYQKIKIHEGTPSREGITFREGTADKKTIFFEGAPPPINDPFKIPDIRVEWELSRHSHFFILGKAFSITKNNFYAKTFQKQIETWIEKNPFLIGPNWKSPMEVGIRLTNWIFAFNFFKESDISVEFWERFTCTIYDHLFYIKKNWETFDKPNNHYIANLVGYFYGLHFFDSFVSRNPQKANKFLQKEILAIYKKILEQFDHQIFPDGTSYEGSTAYHRLVTELFWLFYLVCDAKNIFLPTIFETKLKKMFLFVEHCTIKAPPSVTEDHFIQIGDNDSGKIITGIECHPRSNPNILIKKTPLLSHYPNFGLTIIKNKNFHITFRHPTFEKKQHGGHFHEDRFSITLFYKNIPILVDPGSFVYTKNKFFRDIFRSFLSHNTFYESNQKLVDKNIPIFNLHKTEQFDTAKFSHHFEKGITFHDSSTNNIFVKNSCYRNGKFLSRKIILNQEKNLFQIEDSINKVSPSTDHGSFTWSFLFHPSIIVEKKCNNDSPNHEWNIYQKPHVCTNGSIRQKKLLLCMSSELPLKIKVSSSMQASPSISLTEEQAPLTGGFYSPHYGKIEKCTRLIGEKTCHRTSSHNNLFVTSLYPAKAE